MRETCHGGVWNLIESVEGTGVRKVLEVGMAMNRRERRLGRRKVRSRLYKV